MPRDNEDRSSINNLKIIDADTVAYERYLSLREVPVKQPEKEFLDIIDKHGYEFTTDKVIFHCKWQPNNYSNWEHLEYLMEYHYVELQEYVDNLKITHNMSYKDFKRRCRAYYKILHWRQVRAEKERAALGRL